MPEAQETSGLCVCACVRDMHIIDYLMCKARKNFPVDFLRVRKTEPRPCVKKEEYLREKHRK